MSYVGKSNEKRYNKHILRLRISEKHANAMSESGYCPPKFDLPEMTCQHDCLKCFKGSIKRHNLLCQV